MPATFGLLHLAPLWPAFMAMHPKVTLDVALADRMVDLVDEGHDLAVRIARLPTSTLVIRRLTSTRLIPCASPDSLRRHGTPEHPSDPARHQVISHTLLASGDQWRRHLLHCRRAAQGIELGVCAVYPSRKHLTPKARLLIDCLVEAFRTRAWPA